MAHKAPGKHFRQGMTLIEAMRMFADNAAAEAWFVKVRCATSRSPPATCSTCTSPSDGSWAFPPNARAPPPTVPSAPRSPAWSARPSSSPCSSSTRRSSCETTSWKTLLSDKAGAMRKIEPRSIRNNPENPSRIYVKDNSPGQTPSRARTHQCVHGLAPSATALIPDAKAARRHPLFPARQRIGRRCGNS